MYQDSFPKRVRVLILGGGVHGAGLLHDLASRGWRDIFLVEKGKLACGTSSKSTKLIHGGLRYLKNLRDFGLVHDALRERQILQTVAPDLVRPLELYLPVLREGGTPAAMLWAGLSLYDVLAGKAKIKSFTRVEKDLLAKNVPLLNTNKTGAVFSYWDMQTDDLALVSRIAASAHALGAGICESASVVGIRPDSDGWIVTVRGENGETSEISALYVFNALGPWANRFLLSNNIEPPYPGLNSKGVHLVTKDMGHKVGMFLQSPSDGRIFFLLPWCGYTLIGTTETLFEGDPARAVVEQEDVDYLLERSNKYLRQPIGESDIIASFAGLRWLAGQSENRLGSISRKDLIGENRSGRGLLLTLYGGKLTTYRKFSEQIGNRIIQHFDDSVSTKTHLAESWVGPDESVGFGAHALERFQPGGVAFSCKRDNHSQ